MRATGPRARAECSSPRPTAISSHGPRRRWVLPTCARSICGRACTSRVPRPHPTMQPRRPWSRWAACCTCGEPVKLRFDPDQPHQRAAIAAVLDVLAGQRKVPLDVAWNSGEGVVANALELDEDTLLQNLRAVQAREGLPVDDELAWMESPGDAAMRGALRFLNLSVEMETGTGKTYAYLRTALELAR